MSGRQIVRAGFTPVWRGLLLLPARRRPKQAPGSGIPGPKYHGHCWPEPIVLSDWRPTKLSGRGSG